MDEKTKFICKELVKLTSEEAAEWVVEKYPIDSMNFGEALVIIPHRSWRKADQKRLANYYFQKLPFSGPGGYEAFASFMSIKTLIDCVSNRFPLGEADAELLSYYLFPVLKKFAKNKNDFDFIFKFQQIVDGKN
jgi:hypothetical protein